MSTTTTIFIELFGYVVILLWGMHMVHTGVVRTFGSGLRVAVGAALSNRMMAMVAGLLVTMVLQSSTATAMMATSFAADGTMALVPALAVMLGANVGTALIVKLLSFDISLAAPFLLAAGYWAFKRHNKGRAHDLGRVLVGLGLMLLSLHLIVAAVAPIATSPGLLASLRDLSAHPEIAVVAGALMAACAHSSVAAILLTLSLGANGAIAPRVALALVIGANLGAALPPLLEAGGRAGARRLPVGNLFVRLCGCIVAYPLMDRLAELAASQHVGVAQMAVDFHIALNLSLAIAFAGVLRPIAAVLRSMMPDAPPHLDPGRTLFLDESVLETPYLALANAANEAGRAAQFLDDAIAHAASPSDAAAIESDRRAIASLRDAILEHLVHLAHEPLSTEDAERCRRTGA